MKLTSGENILVKKTTTSYTDTERPFMFVCFDVVYDRNHRMEVQATTIHDAGDYTFVLEGYSQSLSAKVHIIGTQRNTSQIL